MKDRLVTAEINLGAIENNIRELKKLSNPGVRFMAVVKADAYGHGAVQAAEKAISSGADWLGVARLHEAVQLREAGIKVPVLVFGYTCPEQAVLIKELDLSVTVYSFEMAEALAEKAADSGIQLDVHIKIDTGMGRVGIIAGGGESCKRFNDQAVSEIKKIMGLKGIAVKGIYTHFAAADHRNRTYTNMQISLFDDLLGRLEKEKLRPGLCHAANSAGILAYPKSHYDMVRAGISLYGLYPSDETDKTARLIPAMSLKSFVTSVRKVKKGFKVSYGMTWEAGRDTVLATVPVGYADGFSRLFSSNGFMLVGGQRAPIAGRVCMDQTILDVGHIPGVRAGDGVVLIGSQGSETLTADELAAGAKTINYEIVSSLTSRVGKEYV